MSAEKNNNKKSPIFIYYAILLITVLVISYMLVPQMLEPKKKEISFRPHLTKDAKSFKSSKNFIAFFAPVWYTVDSFPKEDQENENCRAFEEETAKYA